MDGYRGKAASICCQAADLFGAMQQQQQLQLLKPVKHSHALSLSMDLERFKCWLENT